MLRHVSNQVANWFNASRYSLAARPQSAVMLRRASHSSLVAAASLGKCPRVLMNRAQLRREPQHHRSTCYTPAPKPRLPSNGLAELSPLNPSART
jgi:hypothetical protein